MIISCIKEDTFIQTKFYFQKKPKKSKKPRKDIGLPKLPVAIELSGMKFDASTSRAVMENSGKIELTKDAIVNEIRDNENILQTLNESIEDSEKDIEIKTDEEQNSSMINTPFFIFPRQKVQAILGSEDEQTDENDNNSTATNEKVQKKPSKKYDFSCYVI